MIQPAVECIQLVREMRDKRRTWVGGDSEDMKGQVQEILGVAHYVAPIIEMMLITYTLRISKVIDSVHG